MIFNYDYFGLTEPARIYLCKTDNTIVCELNGIDLTTVTYTKQLNNFDTLQFDVHRFINGEESNGYDLLDEAMYLFVDGIGYFRMSYPEVSNDGFDEYKSVTAKSCECELALKTLKNFKINTGEVDSREYLIDDNVKETGEGVKIAVKHIILYDSEHPEFSLLDIAIKKVAGWKIGFVAEEVRLTDVVETTVNDDGTVTTTTQTNESKRSFDIDSKNVYAFLTQDVSKKFECVFDFNIMTRTINVYSVKKYGEDSGVFISYRNLIQTLNYAPAQEDNIMTRFEVRGANDLTIDAVNFGTSTIENLSYYLSTKHVGQALIDKYNKWLTDVEEARKKYMYYNRQYSLYMEKRNEVNLRVPNDGLNNNWKQFTVEELGKIKEKYSGYMTALKDPGLGYWDKDNQKWLNKGAEQDYIAYQGILEIIDKTIEYKKNDNPSQDKEKSDEVDDLIEEWNTNWDLFGLQELKTKEKTYLSNIDALKAYAKAWKDLSEDERGHLSKANYNISHNRYLKYSEYEYGKDANGNIYTKPELGGCSGAIKQRQSEYTALQNQMNVFSREMGEVAEVNDKEKYGFTVEELATLNKLYDDTDYTNDNILTISTDTAAKIINTQYELFNDATTELSKVCQPQLSFTLTMDNIFAIPDFKEWQGNFDIGNFIHLSFDRNEQYFLKLRISSLTFNPCIIEKDFQIEFTNMISYNGGRDDFAAILDDTVNTAKDQITGSVKSKLDTTGIEVSDALIQAMVNSSRFTGAVSNGVFNTVNANTGAFGEVLARTINGRDLLANSGLFETINVDSTTSKTVLALDINANRISAGTLSVERLIIRGEKNSIMYSINDTLGTLDSTKISPEDYDKYYMGGKNIQAHTITADQILAHSLTASEITADDLRGVNGWINLHSGTFAFYGKPKDGIIDEMEKDKGLVDNYVESWNESDETSADRLRFKESMNFTPTDLGQDKLQSKIEELKPYSSDSSEVLNAIAKNNLNMFISDLKNYIIWLDVNDKIHKDGKSTVKLSESSDSDIITEFGISNDDAEKGTKVQKIREYLDIIIASENNTSGLMSWNGQKLTIRGDVVANSLTLGENVTIDYNKIDGMPTVEAYIKENGLIVNEPSEGAVGFKLQKNGLLTASNALIYGEIHASSGVIGGMTIDKNIMYSTNNVIRFDGQNGTGNIGPWYINSSSIYRGNGYNVNGSNNSYFGNSGLSISNNFVVDSNGNMTAQNANVSGNITAEKMSANKSYSIFDGSVMQKIIYFSNNNIELSIGLISEDNDFGGAGFKFLKYKESSAIFAYGDLYMQGKDIDARCISCSDNIYTEQDVKSYGLITAYGEFKSEKDLGLDWRFGSSTGSGDPNWFGFYDTTYGYHGGWYGPNHTLKTYGEVQAGVNSANAFRAVYGNYGFIIRNDGANAYFMATNSGNPYGTWNTDNYTTYDLDTGDWKIKGNLTCNELTFKCEDNMFRRPIGSSDVLDGYVASIRSTSKGIMIKGLFGSSPFTTRELAISASDSRLKKNILDTSINNALNQILQIRHRKFDWKSDNTHVDIGYIAQELEKINPRMVFKPEDKDGVYTIDTFYMESLITKSIQEMYSELKSENEQLKKEIKLLKQKIA